jgi:hypothetical protein
MYVLLQLVVRTTHTCKTIYVIIYMVNIDKNNTVDRYPTYIDTLSSYDLNHISKTSSSEKHLVFWTLSWIL